MGGGISCLKNIIVGRGHVHVYPFFGVFLGLIDTQSRGLFIMVPNRRLDLQSPSSCVPIYRYIYMYYVYKEEKKLSFCM